MSLIQRISEIKIKSQLKSIFLSCIPLLIAIITFEYLNLQNVGTRIAAVLVYIVIYLVYNALIKNEGYLYIIQTIKEIRNSSKNQLVS
jgi:hypothetical protein